MPARKRATEKRRHEAAEARRQWKRLSTLERLALDEPDPIRRREMEEESVWADYEINRAAVRYGHCSCGFGRCCSCGGYGVDGPYCGEPGPCD